MSINGRQEELTFTQREEQQTFLSAHKAIRPENIKSPNKGLRAFIFYRNLALLNNKPIHQKGTQKKSVRTISISKRKTK